MAVYELFSICRGEGLPVYGYWENRTDILRNGRDIKGQTWYLGPKPYSVQNFQVQPISIVNRKKISLRQNMPKRVEMVWSAKNMLLRNTNFSQVWNCTKLQDLASLTFCGAGVIHRTPLFFGCGIDMSALYKSAKNNWNICREGPDIASQKVAQRRDRPIARYRAMSQVWPFW